ncbi:hypothetical protein J8C01_07970 [Chloracidobacterium sp. D]|uniref:hypothetical protein n=1 Tax=Chloracidobacterium sp. D TaxID=2821536 RepID=UPI001B8C5E78|nr:hypothetical protein [Chloracidobacterium sp. D]QUV81167.1 hypothetical protein J8C01_07970 [Chloracidobacterium sp. D]
MSDVSPSPSTLNRPRWQLALPALLLVWAVAILPSALPRPWGLLDEQRVWDMATSHGWVDMLFSRNDGERYRPVFWLYYAAIAHGLGPSRTAHHLVQALVLALCGGGYMLLTAQQARVQSWLAWSLPALLFVQSPLAENAYTLAKADWMTALGLLGTLAFGLLALTQPVRWPWWLLAAGMCAGGAVLVKESGLVTIGTVALLGLAGYAARSWRERGLLIWQAAAVLLFVGTYWLPSRHLIQPTTYRLTLADLSLRSMAFNGYIYLTRYPELFLLGGGALAGLWADRQRLSGRHPVALLAGVAFLSGLAALGLLIVWKWPCGYFLMPVVAGWLAALLLTADALASLPRPGRQVVIGLGLLWLTLNVAGFAQTARLQRAVWHGCGMFVEVYARQGTPDSRLFFPEQVSAAEVPVEADNQIKRRGHERLGALAGAGAFALGDDPENADLRLPTAGDYLALRHYARAFGKHVRLFEDCATDRLLPRLEALGWQLTRVGAYHFQMPNFVPGRDLGRTVRLEHDLYRLDAPPPVHFALNGGRWRTDDWAGPRLTLLVNRPGRLVITGEIPAGHPAPVTIDSLVDGVAANRQTLAAGQSSTWEIAVAGAAPGRPVAVTLQAAPAWPAEQLGLRPKGERLSWQLRHIRFIPDET